MIWGRDSIGSRLPKEANPTQTLHVHINMEASNPPLKVVAPESCKTRCPMSSTRRPAFEQRGCMVHDDRPRAPPIKRGRQTKDHELAPVDANLRTLHGYEGGPDPAIFPRFGGPHGRPNSRPERVS